MARTDAGLCHVGFSGRLVAVVSGSDMANLTCSYYCCFVLLFSGAFCFVVGFWILPHIYGSWYICDAS